MDLGMLLEFGELIFGLHSFSRGPEGRRYLGDQGLCRFQNNIKIKLRIQNLKLWTAFLLRANANKTTTRQIQCYFLTR
jgi:hypothetical protein